MSYLLGIKGMAFGMHPEGRRSKDSDPFKLSKAKSGVGHLIKLAPPDTLILPLFIHGLSNQATYEIRQAFNRQGATPIHLFWGEPIIASSIQDKDVEEITTHSMSAIQALSDKARSVITH